MYPNVDTSFLKLMTRYRKYGMPINLEFIRVNANKILQKLLDVTRTTVQEKADQEGFKVSTKYIRRFVKRNLKIMIFHGDAGSVYHSKIKNRM